ncbi:hypothetical protein RHSIM_Rhsim06G0186400 [Rhododendron simsii]|uniref:Uncharacterized protein n=1 Tax=Rhododendron simsii TaxID=118357 RepID=A0A834GTN4_RHOSS|nr:hypothetical protein RHSIM_Rhsim06G0186400 [Rhododendron simsii]
MKAIGIAITVFIFFITAAVILICLCKVGQKKKNKGSSVLVAARRRGPVSSGKAYGDGVAMGHHAMDGGGIGDGGGVAILAGAVVFAAAADFAMTKGLDYKHITPEPHNSNNLLDEKKLALRMADQPLRPWTLDLSFTTMGLSHHGDRNRGHATKMDEEDLEFEQG